MKQTASFQTQLSDILKETGRPTAVALASRLLSDLEPLVNLHLRNICLTSTIVNDIIKVFNSQPEALISLRSISLSYNPISDDGTIALCKNLPQHISEIGLVGCGIGDAGGKALICLIENSVSLKMVCIEGNHFSESIRSDLSQLSQLKPDVVLIY